MSFISPAQDIHRGWNILLGDLGVQGCPAGPVWTERNAGPGGANSHNIQTGTLSAISFGGAASVAVMRVDTTNVLVTAPYPLINVGAGAQTWSCAAYLPGVGAGVGRYCLFAGQAAATATYATSDDEGLTWTVRALPAAIQAGVASAFAGVGVMVLEGDAVSSSVGYFSVDGIVWNLIAVDRASTWSALAYNPNSNLWLAASQTPDSFVSSSIDNGVTWLPKTTYAGAGVLITNRARMVFGRTSIGGVPTNMFLTGADTGTASLASSIDDGATWVVTTAPTGIATQWMTPIFAKGDFMSAGRVTRRVYVGSRTNGFLSSTRPAANQLPAGVSIATQLGYLGNGIFLYVDDGGSAGSGLC